MTIFLSNAGRTFKELQDEVLAHGFSDARYRPRVKAWLNEGLNRIAHTSGLPQLEQTVSVSLVRGQDTYEIPEHLRLLSVRGDGVRLTNVGVDETDDNAGASGVPTSYSLFGGQLTVSPAPTAADELEIRVRGVAQPMVADDDVPGMPDAWVDLLITYALSKAYRAEDDYEASSVYKGEWREGLSEMRNDVQYEDESARRQVNGMMGGRLVPRFHLP